MDPRCKITPAEVFSLKIVMSEVFQFYLTLHKPLLIFMDKRQTCEGNFRAFSEEFMRLTQVCRSEKIRGERFWN